MRLIIDKTLITKALEQVTLANYKTDKTDDSAVSLSADNYTIELSGGNDENHCEIVLEAEVEEPGDIIIPADGLVAQIKSFPSKQILVTGNNEYVYFETSEDTDESLKCNIKVNAVESNKFEDYTPSKVMPVLSVNSDTFATALNAVVLSVDKKSAKEELRNVGVVLTKDKVDFVGFSSKRISVYPLTTNETCTVEGEKRFTISLQVAKNLSKMLKKGKKDVTISIEKNNQGTYFVVANEIAKVYAKLLSNSFPNYARLMSPPTQGAVTFATATLKRVISSIAGISKADAILALTPDTNAMKFSLTNGDSKTALKVPCTMSGDVKETKILGKDLKEAFANITTANCTIGFVKDQLFVLKEEGGIFFFIGSICHP